VSEQRWLVVGLGNPEAEYGATRHNVGADALRVLSQRHRTSLSRNKRVRAEVAETVIAGDRVVLALPTCWMNESGGPVQSAAKWYDVAADRLIVIHDDLDLEIGTIRCKQGGGHAGHNGLRDIDRALGSRDYHRVRVGIGRPPGRQPGKDYVLRRFPPRDRELVDVALQHAADCVETIVTQGIAVAQNVHNGTVG